MKQFSIILKYELKNYLKNKIFVGVTLVLVAVMAIVMFMPHFTKLFGGDEGSGSQSQEVMLVSCPESVDADLIQQAFAAAFPAYKVRAMEVTLDEAKSQITAGEVGCAFVLDDLTAYTYYVNNLTMYDSNAAIADGILQNIYRIYAMTESGISAEEAQNIMSAVIKHETLSLGKDHMQNFFYAYIMIFALYMVILLYGQMVATNVATEKSSRAMELLVTSAKPLSMMFGKVIASCLAGFIQLTVVFGSAMFLYRVNESQWEGNEIISSIFDMPSELFVYLLVFFVLGFLIYAFMYGAIGSTASKLEDINTSVMPVNLLFIAGFSVIIFALSTGDLDTMLVKICSFIPFTSPMAMFARIAMSTVPFYEIAISIAILILSSLGIGILSAKIYRVGVLLYGTPPKLGALLKAVFKK